MSAIEVEVEQHLRVGGVGEPLEEIGGEGGLAHSVVASVDHTHVGQVGHAAAHHVLALSVGEHRAIFLDDQHIERAHLGGGLLHEVPVAQGERVGVHHDDARLRQGGRCGCGLVLGADEAERLTVLANASHARFHEDGLWRLRQQAEGEALEELPVLRFGIELHTMVALGVGARDEMRHDGVGQGFALMAVGHRHTLDDVAPQSTAGDDVAALLVDQGGIVVDLVEPQAARRKKLLNAGALAWDAGVELKDFQCGWCFNEWGELKNRQ